MKIASSSTRAFLSGSPSRVPRPHPASVSLLSRESSSKSSRPPSSNMAPGLNIPPPSSVTGQPILPSSHAPLKTTITPLPSSAFDALASRGLSKQSLSTSAGERPVGVEAAVRAAQDTTFEPKVTIFNEFAQTGKVGMVTGGNGGLGLEMALALAEAGGTVYIVDLADDPSPEFLACSKYAERLGSRLVYIKGNVTDQKQMWGIGEMIAEKEGRIDFCVACAGILRGYDCLDYPGDEFQKTMDVNVNGVLFTAQAAGRQMRKLKIRGSIILIASMSGSITNHGHAWVAYNTSKSAVLQMARSMACELGGAGIRVNTISPGHIYTKMTAVYLEKSPELREKWSSLNPLGRLGMVNEIRGVVTWLASDASTFCTGSDIMVTGGHHAW